MPHARSAINVTIALLAGIQRSHSHTRLASSLLRERTGVLESRLDPDHFFRGHRSAIIRLDLVRAIKTISRYEQSVVLSTGAHAPLSRDRCARLESLVSP
jgi:DNA-binding LytR/AlgR family response regulator